MQENVQSINKKHNNIIGILLFHICVIEMIVFSGEQRFTMTILGIRNEMALLFFSCVFFHLITNRGPLLSRKNGAIIICLTIWTLASSFLFNTYSNDLVWIRYIIFPLSICFFVSACDFYVFREWLLKYLTLLSLFSIFIQIGHDFFHLFPTTNYYFVDHEHYLSLGFFNTEWGANRLASIYWEPGQYQIVINYVLCLFLDELSDFSDLGKIVRKFGILFIALFMTISTTGYITFFIIMLTALLNAKISRGRMVSYLSGMLAILIISNYIYNSSAIQEKLDQRSRIDEVTSYSIRYDDNMALFRCTLEKPITGYGVSSPVLKSKLRNYGDTTSSNGWLTASAQLGIPYFFFLLICMRHSIRKMYRIRYYFPALLALVISQANEALIYLPYIYVYIFGFLSYHEVSQISMNKQRIYQVTAAQ